MPPTPHLDQPKQRPAGDRPGAVRQTCWAERKAEIPGKCLTRAGSAGFNREALIDLRDGEVWSDARIRCILIVRSGRDCSGRSGIALLDTLTPEERGLARTSL